MTSTGARKHDADHLGDGGGVGYMTACSIDGIAGSDNMGHFVKGGSGIDSPGLVVKSGHKA